jgi:hypothetical protein
MQILNARAWAPHTTSAYIYATVGTMGPTVA